VILASPTAFEGIGQAVPDSVIPNNYDTQAYVLALDSGSVEAISRDFDPSIDEAVWSRRDGHIYARATRGSYRKLFRYDVGDREWEELETQMEVVNEMMISSRSCPCMRSTVSMTICFRASASGTVCRNRFRIARPWAR